MPLEPGRRLGPYEILAPLGAGGMGEVYRAKDTRLDRTVAIKVLPSQLSASPDLRQRFEREARTISGLSHAHICTLFDVGHENGVAFLVMEYLEGETLADRLAKGSLSTQQVLRYGMEIADALHVAHRHGVVHRDLKPGNVMLTKSGAKLLDFGLAKFRPPDAAGASELSALPTADKPLTGEGKIVGTFQYMAPEQLEGKEADARTDVFALGTVLYEMTTGRRAFTGTSRASLIGAILKDDPPSITTIQPMTPPALDRVVRTCLAKDPEDRWQSAHDVAAELRFILEAGSQPAAALAVAKRSHWRRSALVAAWFVAGAATAWTALLMARQPEAARAGFPRRAVLELPSGTSLPDLTNPGAVIALSPDATRVALSLLWPGGRRLYLRATDDLDAHPIPGGDRGLSPFFSPDSRWIGFAAAGKLKKVAVGGGEPIVICDAPQFRGASWGPDDTILFAPTVGGGLFRVAASGGTPQAVTHVDPTKGEDHRWPILLPGGKTALFTVLSGMGHEDGRAIAALSLDTGKWHAVVPRGTYPRYLAGQLLYAQSGSLMAAAFDKNRLHVSGPAVRVLEHLQVNRKDNGVANYDVAAQSLVYAPAGTRSLERMLVFVDRQGKARPLSDSRRPYQGPQLSPDGQHLAVGVEGASDDIWVCDLERQTWTRLTFEASNFDPIWSADGRHIFFASSRERGLGIYRVATDGSGAPERVLLSDDRAQPRSASSDGKLVAYDTQRSAVSWDIGLLPLDGDRTPRPWLATPAAEFFESFSPDGRFIAYNSNESGAPESEVYVRSTEGSGRKWLISRDGGYQSVWARSGRELFYWNRDRLMAVPVRTTPEFWAGAPEVLFEGRFERSQDSRSYDVTPDGRGFVMIQGPSEPPVSKIVAVSYWLEEMHSRLRDARK